VWLQYSGTLSYHPSTNGKHLVGLLSFLDINQANNATEVDPIEALRYE
jgi:hypothetical protein